MLAEIPITFSGSNIFGEKISFYHLLSKKQNRYISLYFTNIFIVYIINNLRKITIRMPDLLEFMQALL